MISYLLLGVEDKHDIIRSSIVEYIVNLNNLVRLRSYISQEFSTGEEYVKANQMHPSTHGQQRWNSLPVHSCLGRMLLAILANSG